MHAVLDWLMQHNSQSASYTYLYGHSGGGRMSWRIACNSTLGLRLAGVLVTSALLPANLRTSASPTCSVSAMPPVIVTHGTKDTITDVSFEDESVAWLAVAAKCSISTSTAGVSKDPVADLVRHTDCVGARPGFKLAYYRLKDAPHDLPTKFWYSGALKYWIHGVGPGMEGFDAIMLQSSAGRRSARTHHVVTVLIPASICFLLGVSPLRGNTH